MGGVSKLIYMYIANDNHKQLWSLPLDTLLNFSHPLYLSPLAIRQQIQNRK